MFEGENEDVLRRARHLPQPNRAVSALVVRAVSFFESDYFVLEKDGVRKLPAALRRRQGLVQRRLIATLRKDFDSDGVSLPKAR